MSTRTVLITGANRGIGLGLTQWFLKHGDTVVATARKPEDAKDLQTIANEMGGRLKVVGLDVTNRSAVESLPASLEGITALDLLINNAGVALDAKSNFETLSLDVVDQIFQTNSIAPMAVTRTLLPLLKKSKKPTVVHITSQMGSIADNGSGGYYGYRMSKAALNMFNKSFAVDFPAITSVVLHPGWVQTDMGSKAAPLTVDQSVQGLTHVIQGLSGKSSGKFFNYKGEEIPW